MANLKPIQTLRPFTRFCCTIGNLPSSYLVSLTYEEQLLWLCDYLKNTVIPTINNNASAVEELQNFVNNFFKNLNVQDEINNKLDEMVESGEFQNIINQFLRLNSLLCFNNVEDMKNSINLINGSFAMTLGYYKENDGGKSIYKIRNRQVNDIIDNASIIELKNNLIAQLITDKVNIKQFGAYGDGVTDDSEHIQNAINFCTTHNYNLYIDNNSYLINNTIEINTNNFNFHCDGELIINTDITLFNIIGQFHTIYINKLVSANNIGNALLFSGNNWYSDITVNEINGFNKGLYLYTTDLSKKGIQYSNFNFNYINCEYDIYLDCENSWINQNIFNGGQLSGINNITMAEINDGDQYNGNTFNNIGFEGGTIPITLNNASRNKFINFRMIEELQGDIQFILKNCIRNEFISNFVIPRKF